MNAISNPDLPAGALSRRARLRMEQKEPAPLFLANWSDAVFIHYETDPAALQSCVPFELDLYEGKACVSLVAFVLDHMRPALVKGRLGEWLMRPIAPCRFLNIRTYVKHRGETGIYFLAEWLSRQAAVPFGPMTFGLPYRFGMLDYSRSQESSSLRGEVRSAYHGRLAFSGSWNPAAEFLPSPAGSLCEFLLERYTAFTEWEGHRRFFRVSHEPWPQAPLTLHLEDESLLFSTGQWIHHATCLGGNITHGVASVQMGVPHALK